MVTIIPRIKPQDNTTWMFRFFVVDTIIISFQDFMSPRRHEFNSLFHRVKQAGGLHAYLGYSGRIILSLIIKDEMISSCNPDRYAIAIKILKPDTYTAVDGETYQSKTYKHEGKICYDGEELALIEIYRACDETNQLLKLCPEYECIGIVKGCTRDQILLSVRLQKSLGIGSFILHMGDFFRTPSKKMQSIAKTYAALVRKEAKEIYLYGFCAQKKLIEFSFAGAYITFSHFVKARNGKYIIGAKEFRYDGGYDPRMMVWNFSQMQRNVRDIHKQRNLGGDVSWEADSDMIERAMHQEPGAAAATTQL